MAEIGIDISHQFSKTVEELDETDLETQIQEAVSELTEEDLEGELDTDVLLDIASSEIDSFDSLTSESIKLALNEEVETEKTDALEIEDLKETQVEESEVLAEEIQGLEALENLLEILKNKNILASIKGQKININITIGEE